MALMGLAAALGSLIGLILAFTGAGGGILAIPLLMLGLGLPVQQAAPIGLAAVGLASALGAVLGLREGSVRYRAAAVMGGLGMVTAPMGVAAAQWIPNRPLMAGFGLVLAFVAWRMLVPAAGSGSGAAAAVPPCRLDPAAGRLLWTSRCFRTVALTGAASGLLSGLLGVGGGFVIVPALARSTDLDIHSVQTTSLAVIALVSISGVGAAAWHGSLDVTLAAPFAVGACVALLLGRRVASRLSASRLKQAFAWLSLAVATGMVARAAGLL